MTTVVIVGGGFCGALTAVRLLNHPLAVDLRVVLIEARSRAGLGVAYGTDSPHHMLNVPAGRMTALPESPGDFLQWLERLGFSAAADSFVPRRLYGQYVGEHLTTSAARAGPRFARMVGRATHLHVVKDRNSFRVQLEDGPTVSGEFVVLATGNAAPADPLARAAIELGDDEYTRDPWDAAALGRVPSDVPTLLIGAGLTMVDVAVELHQRGHRAGLTALSRHGRMSQPQRITHPPTEIQPPHELLAGDGRLNRAFRLVRAAIKSNQALGCDWRDTIKSLRPITSAIWQKFPESDRARFLRHVQVLWDTHRHQIPPQSADILQRLRERETFRVLAGRITAIARSGAGLQVSFRPRGKPGVLQVQVGHIVNCTGAQSDVARMPDPLIRQMLRDGLIVRDPLGLGVLTGNDGSLIDAAGRESRRLFTLGAWRRPQLWESTAVPELRQQAADLSDRLVDLAAAENSAAGPA